MRASEIDVFDSNLNPISFSLSEDADYTEDYLDPEKSSVRTGTEIKAEKGNYIRVRRPPLPDIFGIIDEIKKKSTSFEIDFTEFMTKFDLNIMLDIRTMTGTLENFIKTTLEAWFTSNTDTLQNIKGLTCNTISSTSEWTLGIDPDDESNYAKVNLFDDIILPSIQSYGIIVTFSIDVMAKTIIATIGQNTSAVRVIEADLPNVIDKTITIRKTKKQTNKIYIYNKKDYSRNCIYYLYSDGTYGNDDKNRVTPVSFSIETVSTDVNTKLIDAETKTLTSALSGVRSYNKKAEITSEDTAKATGYMNGLNTMMGFGFILGADNRIYASDGTTLIVTPDKSTEDVYLAAINAWPASDAGIQYGETQAAAEFAAKAKDKAESVFSKNKYEDLIEIECINDDPMIEPDSMSIGQKVRIVSGGKEYTSILTARERKDTTTLTFGLLRLELTKILKGRY